MKNKFPLILLLQCNCNQQQMSIKHAVSAWIPGEMGGYLGSKGKYEVYVKAFVHPSYKWFIDTTLLWRQDLIEFI